MVDLTRCNTAGALIAATVPIVEHNDAEVVLRTKLVQRELDAMGVQPGPMVWRYTLHEDGQEHGQWARSDEKAAIECAMWWHVPVVAVSIEPIDALSLAPAVEPTLW